MTDNVIRLYNAGEITKAGLARAVALGWLAADQYAELAGEEYTPPVNDYAAYHAAMTEELV